MVKNIEKKSSTVDQWLNEFSNNNTKRLYSERLNKFLLATGKQSSDLENLDVKEIKNIVLNYQASETKKSTPNNTILGVICAVRSYCSNLDKPIKFRRGQLCSLKTDTDSHEFTNGDLKLMFDVGDTFDKALLSTAISLGWEVSSFLELDKDTIKQKLDHAIQNNEQFIFFEETRKKTGVLRFTVLNPLAIEWLTKYLDSRTDNDKRLFPITVDGVQKLLYRLAKDSGLKATGNIRFHKIRAWLMCKLSKAGFNSFQSKFLIGHSIAIQDRAYLTDLKQQIEEKYPKVYNEHLNISAHADLLNKDKAIENLQKQLTDLQNKKGLEALMEIYKQKQQEINNEALQNSVKVSNTGDIPYQIPESKPIIIESGELLTLKALAKTFQQLYSEK